MTGCGWDNGVMKAFESEQAEVSALALSVIDAAFYDACPDWFPDREEWANRIASLVLSAGYSKI